MRADEYAQAPADPGVNHLTQEAGARRHAYLPSEYDAQRARPLSHHRAPHALGMSERSTAVLDQLVNIAREPLLGVGTQNVAQRGAGDSVGAQVGCNEKGFGASYAEEANEAAIGKPQQRRSGLGQRIVYTAQRHLQRLGLEIPLRARRLDPFGRILGGCGSGRRVATPAVGSCAAGRRQRLDKQRKL
jgi:hypothetical protein